MGGIKRPSPGRFRRGRPPPPPPWPSPCGGGNCSSLVGRFSLGVWDNCVAAELVAHHRQHPVAKRVLHAASEACKERLRDDRNRHRFVNGRLDGPASLACVLYIALDSRKFRILRETSGD